MNSKMCNRVSHIYFLRLLAEMNTPLAWPDPEVEVRYIEHYGFVQFLNHARS